MSRREILGYTAVLVLLGAGWGITLPLTKLAVSTGHGHFGLVFWQAAVGALALWPVCRARGSRFPRDARGLRFCGLIALIGTLLPNTASYQAAAHLPAGVLSLLLSLVPIYAFPIALALGNDRFAWRRLAGLVCGLTGVLLIVTPGVQASLGLPVFWVAIGLISGMFYALEGNVVARWGTGGLDPFELMWGASVLAALASLPLALLSGQFIDPRAGLGVAEAALVGSSVVHVVVYVGYVWLVGQAGAVFAVQVSYLVTGFGLIWARLLLSESYPPMLWVALAVMFLGLYLVQPGRKEALAGPRSIGETGPGRSL